VGSPLRSIARLLPRAAPVKTAAAPVGLSRDQVIAAFELLLGLRPVNEWQIEAACRFLDLRALVDHLIGSAEFRERYDKMNGSRVPQPPRPAPIFLGDRVLAWTHRGQRIYLVPQDVDLTPHIMLTGTWETHVEATLLRLARPGHVAIDLGANVGYHTIVLGAAVAPTGRVFAFEAQPQLARLLRATIFVNGLLDLAEIHCCAVSDRPGNVVLAAAPDHYGSGNLTPAFSPPGYDEGYSERVEVPAATLDQMLGDRIGAIDLMHLDIEGAEPLALRGAQSLIERSPALKIVTEWSVGMMSARADVAEFAAWLDGMGFRFWRVEPPPTNTLTPLSRDTLSNLPHSDLLLSRIDPESDLPRASVARSSLPSYELEVIPGADVILFSVSLPGRFGDWCNAVLAKVAGHAGSKVAAFTLPSLDDLCGFETPAPMLDELAHAMIASDASHFAIAIRRPDQRLRDALRRDGARLVLALDDPCDAVAGLVESGIPARTAVRAIANCYPMMMPIAAQPGVLTVHAADARADPARTIAAIASYFDLAIDPDAVPAIVAALPPPTGALGNRLPADAAKMAEGALGAYRKGLAGERLDRIIWTRELFIRGDIAVPPTMLIEVGGGRMLVYGPYIQLPAGSWSAQVVLGFSPQTAPSSFLVDIYAEGQLASTTMQPGSGGVYTAELIFSVAEPRGKGIEVRVLVASNQAAGWLAFGHVILQPLAIRDADATAEASSDFERVLDL
jgi:FkbM family methyltransferase